MEEEKMAGTMQAEGSYCDPERVDKATEPPDHEMATSGLEENTEMWMEGGGEPDDCHQRLEMDGDDEDESIFYGSFPTLPEFPCMSSSSSSSLSAGGGGGGGGVRPSASCSSSSSSTKMSSSWAVMKLDKEDVGAEKSHPSIAVRAVPLPMTEGPVLMQQEEEEEGMDVLEEMGDMNLLDSSGMWDPSTLFNGDDEEKTEQQQQEEQEQQQSESVGKAEDDGFQSVEEEMMDDNSGRPSEDLAMVFFEWLKSNKESISPEDLRSIKLKRSTIECAARRLGGGKEGMKQLLKLILAWVQNHQLQKKRNKDEEYMPTTSTNPPPPPAGNAVQYQQQQQQLFPAIQVQLPSTNAADSSGPWMNPHLGGYLPHDPNAMPPQPSAFPHHMMMGFVGDGGFSGAQQQQQHTFSSPAEYHQMIESNMQWSPHFSCYGSGPFSDPSVQQPLVGFPNKYSAAGAGQFFQGHHHHGVFGEPLMKMTPSATKEARKKRMARQRRFFSHHHHHRHHNHHQQNHQHHLPTATTAVDQHQHPSRLAAGNANCTTATTAAQNSSGNWVMWPSSSSPSTSPSSTMLPSDADLTAMQPQQRPMPSDRRPGWKSEKNLRFLLQKVLKQSDVGNLGRIVLPKKEAETHLPELDARDGISIAMEDIGTSRIWNMRYRFWPNNKSRMYLLENTGDFVRTNGLQEGDFIVIYSDTKCGKYMIRGVKVRKPELKPDVKTTAKTPKASSSHVSSKEGGSSLPSCNR